MSQNEVTIYNQSSDTIWVIITENEKHVIEQRTDQIGEYDFETYYSMMCEGKAALPIEGVPIEVSGKRSTEFKLRLKEYWEQHKEDKFQWSGFVTAGELEIAPLTHNKWALKGDESRYFISIRAMGGRIVANAVSRRDSKITIDQSGHILDPEAAEVLPGKAIYFQLSEQQLFVGDPQLSNWNWDSGTCLDAAGKHVLDPGRSELESGVVVRIVSQSSTLADADYKFMYASDKGNVYYDKRRGESRAGKKQSWKISKTAHPKNSDGLTLRYGDRVKISNVNWPKANLGVNGKWLQCMNDDPTIWILREQGKA